jgi:biopolymer transport protein TolR
MAFGRLERTPGHQPMSEINVTPLVDVMLVLVVIFIITAPLLASSIRLDLPKADGATPASHPRSPCPSTGRAGLPGRREAVTRTSWPKAAGRGRRNPDTEVQLRADRPFPTAGWPR